MPPTPEAPSARRRARAAGAQASAVPASGHSRPIVLARPPYNYLTEGQVEQIHAASLAILSKTGVAVNEPHALQYFRRAGARVEDGRVFLAPDLIETALKTAPAAYTLHARNPANTLTIGGEHCAVMPSGGAPFVRDLAGARRPGTLADLENFTRLSTVSPEIHILARKAVEAQDVPVPARHLECWRALLVLGDKPGSSGMTGGRAEAEDVLQMLAIVFDGEANVDGRPVAQCNINVNSPLLFDTAMLEGLLTFARYGQPVVVTPFVMAGAMGPATLAGALAQHNAEVLAGAMLTQLARPGAPVVYGSATSNADLRSGAPATGSPESAMSAAVSAQMARRYGLPCRGGGALTDSHVPDAQSNYERALTLLLSVLSGVNFLMHGAGMLEAYLTTCYEQFVIDTELIAMVRHLAGPLEISDETLALDTIHQVGPGGFFLDAAHTLRHYREAHFMPRLSQRNTYEQWAAEGAQDAAQRANRLCREMLAAYVQPPLPADVAGRLHDFVERRKRELLL